MNEEKIWFKTRACNEVFTQKPMPKKRRLGKICWRERSLKRAIRPCDINTLAAAYVTGVHCAGRVAFPCSNVLARWRLRVGRRHCLLLGTDSTACARPLVRNSLRHLRSFFLVRLHCTAQERILHTVYHRLGFQLDVVEMITVITCYTSDLRRFAARITDASPI